MLPSGAWRAELDCRAEGRAGEKLLADPRAQSVRRRVPNVGRCSFCRHACHRRGALPRPRRAPVAVLDPGRHEGTLEDVARRRESGSRSEEVAEREEPRARLPEVRIIPVPVFQNYSLI